MSNQPSKESELRAALTGLETAEIAAIVDRLNAEGHAELKRLLGIQVRARFIRGGMVGLVKAKIRNQTAWVNERLASVFSAPVLIRVRELLGDEAFDDPTLEQLAGIVGPLVDEFGLGSIRLVFQLGVHNEVNAAPHLAALLADDGRLAIEARAGEGDVVRADDGVAPVVTVEQAAVLEAELPEEERALFSPLDRLLITTAVATHNDQLGAPKHEELTQIIEEVVTLNATRIASFFHLGFLSALGHAVETPPETGANTERREWFAYGRLSGITRRGDPQALVTEALTDRTVTEAIIEHLDMGRGLTAPIVRALLADHPSDAAALLERRSAPFADMTELLAEVFEAARLLLAAEHPTDAARLFESLTGWAPTGVARVNLARRLASCRRASNDFPGAARLLEVIDAEGLSDEELGLIDTERGLIEAQIDHLGHIRFPRDVDEAELLCARLSTGERHFRSAVERNEADERANYCLGVLAWCRGDHEEAAITLERAEAAMRSDDLYLATGLLPGAQFHRALAVLLTLREGTDGYAFKSLSDALGEGYRPGDDQLVEAVHALQAHGSPHTAPFVATALDAMTDRSRLHDAITSLAAAGDAEMIGLAERLALGEEGGLSTGRRLEAFAAVLDGAALVQDHDRLERLPDGISQLLFDAADSSLDQRYLDLLDEKPVLREAIGGIETDLTRIDLLARSGSLGEAVEIAARLFHRAAGEELSGYEPGPLLELLRSLGASNEMLETCERRMGDAEADSQELLAALDGQPIRLAFVGGDERQAQYRDFIDNQIEAEFGGEVTVTWHFPGWGTNWASTAESVESSYWKTEALVLMPFVRTNLGRRLRRTSGEHSTPWIACPGHGRAAIMASLHTAVEVAISLRT